MKTRAYDMTPSWAHVTHVTIKTRAVTELSKVGDWWVESLPTDFLLLALMLLMFRRRR